MLKKADIAVFCVIIVLCILSAVFIFSKNGKSVVIKEGNETVCTLPLEKDAEYRLENNTIVIKNGKAYMESASCPDQICVKHTAIRKSGQSIVCLPNRVIVEVE